MIAKRFKNAVQTDGNPIFHFPDANIHAGQTQHQWNGNLKAGGRGDQRDRNVFG
jgi:hypothetical protein